MAILDTDRQSTLSLIRVLILRDLRTRYKVTALGFLWSLLRPLILTAILWIVGGVFLRFQPYYAVSFGVFLITGLLPWTFLAGSLTDAAAVFPANAALIRKVYFPRIVFPVVAVGSNLVNFLLGAAAIFAVLLLVGSVKLSLSWLLLPVILAIHVLLVLGLALCFSVANVYFRDTAMILEFVLQAWFYLTPIFYPIDFALREMNDRGLGLLATLFPYLNPMASLTYAYRRAFLGGLPEVGAGPPFPDTEWPFHLGGAMIVSILVFALGVVIYHRFKGGIADEV